MEFGDTIPLYFITLCCIITTPLIGFSALAFIRFSLKDKALARNILMTNVIVACIPVLYMIYGFIRLIFLIPGCCSKGLNLININLQEILSTTSEIISTTLPFLLWMIFLSLTVSFLIAFIIVLPATLIFRKLKNENELQGRIH